MQESQKNAINPFCPGSSSGWVWELMGCGIHHGNMDLWGCLSQPGGFNLSSLPGAGGDLGKRLPVSSHQGLLSISTSRAVKPRSPPILGLSPFCPQGCRNQNELAGAHKHFGVSSFILTLAPLSSSLQVTSPSPTDSQEDARAD